VASWIGKSAVEGAEELEPGASEGMGAGRQSTGEQHAIPADAISTFFSPDILMLQHR
jgi:hypothetical protein